MYYSSRNHSHISNTPVLITQIVTMILVAALIFQVSNIAKTITTNETAATKTVTTANSSTIAITPDDYTYTVYGQLHQLTTLGEGDSYGLVAFEPYTRSKDGVKYYEEYGWHSCYIPRSELNKISELVDPENPGLGFKEPEERFFKIEMTNDANAGGYIDLPNIILRVEEITEHDLPAWTGA